MVDALVYQRDGSTPVEHDEHNAPPSTSPLVRAQMTDWLLERDGLEMGIDRGEPWVTNVNGQTHEGATIGEALARCVLEVSRADD